MDIHQTIRTHASEHAKELYAFLRELISIQSYDGAEREAILRIKTEMDRLGFDRTWIDPMGNLLGWIGNGPMLVAMDGHCDTVSQGNLANWTFDPFTGTEDDTTIGGLGSSDQKGGIASMIYGAKIAKDLGLLDQCTLLVAATVQEEDNDGLCWQYIIEQDNIRPQFAILSEPSDSMIRNGQRGRMEIRITTHGRSSHGSMPSLGVNAVYRMAPIISAIERMATRFTDDGILGPGDMTISGIEATSPSRCAVADSCTISIDRRLNSKESADLALRQLCELPEVKAANAEVSVYTSADPSWTGLVYESEKYYPSWVVDPDHPVCRIVRSAYERITGTSARVCPWLFSTNGVAIMGRHGIPCIGYGPGHVDQAHRPNERTWKAELIQACAIYAAIPAAIPQQYPYSTGT